MKSDFSVKKIISIGLFSALGVVLGFAMAPFPNIELVTATIFISGQAMGIQSGLVVGLLTESLYSLLSPYGIAPAPIFLAQIISMMLVGYWGGRFNKFLTSGAVKNHVLTGLSGFALTLVFIVLTFFGDVVTFGFNWYQMRGYLIQGIPFYLVQILSNTCIFMLIVPVVVQRLNRVKD